MPGKEIFLSREGYDKMMKELEYLKKVKRRELSKAIGEAREKGDLRENAEYTAAKEEQARVEHRIVQLEEKLSQARILEEQNIQDDKVYIGATVSLLDMDTRDQVTYTLVDPDESDSSSERISINSPIAQALLGHLSRSR